jgi:hypothetical protein
MIGHGNECIDSDARIIGRYFIPNRLNHFPRIIQTHFAICDFSEQALPILGADGNEIGPGLGIIVSLSTDGTAVVNGGIVFPVGANLRVRPFLRVRGAMIFSGWGFHTLSASISSTLKGGLAKASVGRVWF